MQHIFTHHTSRRYAGFSLIEVLVAIGIFALLVASITAIFLNSTRAKDIIFEQLLTQSEGRRAVINFINDVRRANYSSIGAYPLQTAGTSTIVFYSDIDGDTLRERIRYFTSSTILERGVIKPTGTPLSYPTSSEVVTAVAHSVANTSSVFYYYDQNYAGASTSTPLSQPVNVMAVRLVEIRLVLERDPFKSPVPLYVQTKTEIRNLKSN